MSKKNKTLKDILDCILYENPSTQDEIAEKLDNTPLCYSAASASCKGRNC